MHWLCGTCLSICFNFRCLWGQECQPLLQSPLWNEDLVLPGSCLDVVHHHNQPQGLPVCPLLTPGLTKWWAIFLHTPFLPELYLLIQQSYPAIPTALNRLFLQEDLGRGCPVPKGRRFTPKGCWCRINPCTPRPHSTEMRTPWSNLIKWISTDATRNPRWKFRFLIMQQNGSKWWITQGTSVSLLRLVLLTLADVFVIFTAQCELR